VLRAHGNFLKPGVPDDDRVIFNSGNSTADFLAVFRLRVSSDVSRMCCVFSFAIGYPRICILSFLTQSTILIRFVPFESSMESHLSSLELNRWLNAAFSVY
jgi:hypothetical protein